MEMNKDRELKMNETKRGRGKIDEERTVGPILVLVLLENLVPVVSLRYD